MSSIERPSSSRTTRSLRSLTGRSIKSEPKRPQSAHSPPPVLRIPSIDHIEEKHEKRRRRESLAAMAAAEAQAQAKAAAAAAAATEGRSSDERTSTPDSFASVRNSNGGSDGEANKNGHHHSHSASASNNSSTSTLSTPNKQTLFALSTRESVNWKRLEEAPQSDGKSSAAPNHQGISFFRGGSEQNGLDSPRSFVARGWAAATTALGSPRSGSPMNQQAQQQRTSHIYSGKSHDTMDTEKGPGGASNFYGSAVAITTGGQHAVPMAAAYQGLGREGERSPRGRRREGSRHRGSGGDSMLRAWGWEMLSLLVAVVGFVSMIVMLANVNGRPLTSLPFHLPALLAALSTLTKAALLLPVSSSIGQFKWLWLTGSKAVEDRPLTDMQRFDDASRGVTGSLRFLARPSRWLSFASLAALVTVVSFAVSPVSQLAVDYLPAPSSMANAGTNTTSALPVGDAAARANTAGLPTLPALRSLTVAPDTEAAVLAAVMAPPMGSGGSSPVADLGPTCPSGNCVFPPFRTLAICVEATDTTSLLRTVPLASSGPDDWTTWPRATNFSLGDQGASVAGPTVGGPATNVTMHDGEWFVAPAGTVGIVSAASTVTAPRAPGSDGGVVDEASIIARVNLVWSTTPSANQAFNSQQLLFYLCVQQQSVVVRDGSTTVTRALVSSTVSPPSTTPITRTECGRRDDDDSGHHYPQACNVAPSAPGASLTFTASTGETFTAAAPAVAAIGNFLLQFFPGYASAFPGGSGSSAAYADTGDTQLGRLFRAAYPTLSVSANSALVAPAVPAGSMQSTPGDPAAGAAQRMSFLGTNIGTSLTNAVRLSSSTPGAATSVAPGPTGTGTEGGLDGSADTAPIAGTPLGPSVLMVSVRWPILALLAACLALACTVLTAAIVATALEASRHNRTRHNYTGGTGGDVGHPGAGAAVKNSSLALVFALKRRGIMTTTGGAGGAAGGVPGGASVVGLRGKRDMEREAIARGMRVSMVGGGAVVVAAAPGASAV